MKKLIFASAMVLTVLGTTAIPLTASAVEVPKQIQVINKNKGVATTIQNIINILLGVAGAIAVIILVFAGFRYAAAAGNEDTIESAKKSITYTIIGLVIIAFAAIIVNVIVSIIPGITPANVNL